MMSRPVVKHDRNNSDEVAKYGTPKNVDRQSIVSIGNNSYIRKGSEWVVSSNSGGLPSEDKGLSDD